MYSYVTVKECEDRMVFFSLENLVTLIIGSVLGIFVILRYPQRTIFKGLSLLGFVVYVVMLIKVVFGPLGTTNDDPIIWFNIFSSAETNALVTHWFLNLLLTFPLGVFYIITFNLHHIKPITIIAVIVTVPFAIESIQLILSILIPSYSLHQFAFDDILLNSIGSILGFYLTNVIVKVFKISTGVTL